MIRGLLETGSVVGFGWDWSNVARFYERPADYFAQYQALRRSAVEQAPADLQLLTAYHARIIGRIDDARAALNRLLRASPDDFLAHDLQDQLPPDLDVQHLGEEK